MNTRVLAAIVIVVLALIAGDAWLRRAETVGDSRFVVHGPSPWCTVPRSDLPADVEVKCRWLSEQHCKVENEYPTAAREVFCVPRPR